MSGAEAPDVRGDQDDYDEQAESATTDVKQPVQISSSSQKEREDTDVKQIWQTPTSAETEEASEMTSGVVNLRESLAFDNQLDSSSGLLDKLLHRNIITRQQKEDIEAETVNEERQNKLLDILLRRDDLQQQPSDTDGTTPDNRYTSCSFLGETRHISYSELTDLNKIDSGGFGDIFQAIHREWGEVVYKELKSSIIKEGSKAEDELKREVKLHRLNHVNIVKLYAMVYQLSHYGVVVEFVPHGNLNDFVYNNKPVSWSKKLILAHGVVCGMEYLHSIQPHPVIHGDLKIQNILVGDGLVAKICDFGLSKWKTYSELYTTSRSKRVGTVSHIPPEMWMNINLHRTTTYDVYGFAILLWQLFAEQEPYNTDNADQIKSSVLSNHRPDLGAVIGLKTLVTCITDCLKRCWHQTPEKRPSFADLNKEFVKSREIAKKYTVKALEENTYPEDIEHFQQLHQHEEESQGRPNENTQFVYAFVLVQSKQTSDIRYGIGLLQELCIKSANEKRNYDYWYFLAIGHCRLQKYEAALKYTSMILKAYPTNRQAKQLEDVIRDMPGYDPQSDPGLSTAYKVAIRVRSAVGDAASAAASVAPHVASAAQHVVPAAAQAAAAGMTGNAGRKVAAFGAAAVLSYAVEKMRDRQPPTTP